MARVTESDLPNKGYQNLEIIVRQARQLKSFPDSLHKFLCVHRLWVFCKSRGGDFIQAFEEHLSADYKRLKERWGLWGVRNGSELMADQIAKTGGGQ